MVTETKVMGIASDMETTAMMETVVTNVMDVTGMVATEITAPTVMVTEIMKGTMGMDWRRRNQ